MNNVKPQKELVCGMYTRKSTTGEDRQMLSHEDQERDLLEIERTQNLKVAIRYTGKINGESQSAHKRGRPKFGNMMQQVDAGKINALIAWHPNRIARNAFDGGWVITAMDEGKLLALITKGRTYYNTSNDKFMLQLEFGMAKKSSDDNGDAVKRGITSTLKMGRYPSHAPLGYRNSKFLGKGQNHILKDEETFELVKRLWQMMLTGNYTPPQLVEISKQWGLKTQTTRKYVGKETSRSHIYRIFHNTFYYGEFEFPKGSGEWYTGTHEPMITEEEFNRVQVLLGNKKRPRPLTRRFAFTGLMRCGHCGAMITAEEKTKCQKNGNVHTYVYYRCTKRIDKKCPEKTVEINELTSQIDMVISGLTISDKFRDWAIKYLHEVRKNEATTNEQAFANKQKRLLQITKQIDALLLKYTASENADGQLISDSEYKALKHALTKEKTALESDVQVQGKEMEKWVELSERTFNFARYASLWFKNGDMETKRAIFSCLGSNLLLKERTMSIDLHKPFKLIFDNLDKVEREVLKVRTSENEAYKGQKVFFDPKLLTLRRRRDSNS